MECLVFWCSLVDYDYFILIRNEYCSLKKEMGTLEQFNVNTIKKFSLSIGKLFPLGYGLGLFTIGIN